MLPLAESGSRTNDCIEFTIKTPRLPISPSIFKHFHKIRIVWYQNVHVISFHLFMSHEPHPVHLFHVSRTTSSTFIRDSLNSKGFALEFLEVETLRLYPIHTCV